MNTSRPDTAKNEPRGEQNNQNEHYLANFTSNDPVLSRIRPTARLDQIGREHLDLADALDRWITVPGVDRVAAWSFIAEMGIDVTQFPTAAHLAS